MEKRGNNGKGDGIGCDWERGENVRKKEKGGREREMKRGKRIDKDGRRGMRKGKEEK